MIALKHILTNLLFIAFNFLLSFRQQLNVICSINLLGNNSHLIFNWQLKEIGHDYQTLHQSQGVLRQMSDKFQHLSLVVTCS